MSLRDLGPNELMFLIMATRWTIHLALIAFAGGGVIGLIVAALRVAPVPPLLWLAAGYIQFFMGTPILIQLFMPITARRCSATGLTHGWLRR